ncbi:hypothetical protein PRCB_10430 [Pantoea rodasii]|uniref:Uncharacterized protein n=1 Tax=Pantoea rodasii TaxID=1076549 RepID=A0A2M9WE16_9GAMM|nr:hypothetical protein PRCB_10430 [Pantoea rodasii]
MAIALSSDLTFPEPCRELGIYPSYFKFLVRWLRAFTSVTDFSKLLRIHALAACLKLELFRVAFSYEPIFAGP